VRLNVGCGEFRAEGWVNMDLATNEFVKPDLVGSLLYLPPAAELSNVEQVYLGHVLEHISPNIIASALQVLWSRCVDGARIAIVGPDVDRAGRLHFDNKLDWTTLSEALTGGKRWDGDQHLWSCNEERLLRLVKMSGLRRCRAVPIGSSDLDDFPVTSRAPWQCAVIGSV
jgi:hypothetical protein